MKHTRKSFIAATLTAIGAALLGKTIQVEMKQAINGDGHVEAVHIRDKDGKQALYGQPFAFGVQPAKPFIGLAPDVKMRVRMRKGEFAIAYAKSPQGIVQGYIGDAGENWTFVPREYNQRA